jgi:hypothetical protein
LLLTNCLAPPRIRRQRPAREARTYVTTQQVAPATYGQPIVVGHTIDGDVAWLDLHEHPKYRWAYLGGRRVVVDTDTHTVEDVY